MARRWAAVEKRLQGEIEKVAREIERLQQAGEPVPPWKIYQMGRYQSLMLQLQGELTRYYEKAIPQIEDAAKKAREQGIEHARLLSRMAAAQAGLPVAQVELAFDRLGVDAAEKIAGLSSWSKPLGELLSRAYPIGASGITNSLITGAALGWNPRKTAREAARGGLSSAFNHILLVSRDQTIRNYREAKRDSYEKSRLIYGYMRVASKSKRTCMACLALDGTIYPVNDSMAIHPQDRCAMIPLIQGAPLPKYEKGLDWFQRQPEAVQRKRMGPKKWESWQEGDFHLDKLVTITHHPVWGASSRVSTLRDLKAGLGGYKGQVGQGIPSRDSATILSDWYKRKEAAGVYVPKIGGVTKEAPAPKKAPEEETAVVDFGDGPLKVPKFKTRGAAADWLKDNGLVNKADFGKLKMETIQELAESAAYNYQRFPQLKEQVQFFGSAQAGNRAVKDMFRPEVEARIREHYQQYMSGLFTQKEIEAKIRKEIRLQLNRYAKRIDGRAYALSYRGGHLRRLVVNEKYGKDYGAFVASLQNDVKSGWHPPGTDTVKAVMDHEFGHQIDDLLNLTRQGMIPELREIYSGALNNGGIGANLSRYAQTNPAEFVAEAWAEYLNNPEPRPVAQAVGDLILKKHHELFGGNE